MRGPRTHIYLGVEDVNQSALFYEALLGGPPASRETDITVFEFDAPPLVLTIASRRAASARAPTHGFALVVPQPEHVGKAAIALRRAGARLRLQDEGIETRDPDGNTWKVRFVPSAKARSARALPLGDSDAIAVVVPARQGAAR
jgi:catechol 2,3-dioxygenase-like lactoylglutathione lyase family enzyme